MGFSLSPAVIVNEKDFTSIVPAVSTSAGAFAGVFSWGPIHPALLAKVALVAKIRQLKTAEAVVAESS